MCIRDRVSTSLGGVLTVDDGVIFFSVLSGVGEVYFDVFSFQVDDRVEAGCRHVVIQQVYKTVTLSLIHIFSSKRD